MAEVTAAAKRISGGSYGAQLDNHYQDEIGELIDSINDMSMQIGRNEKMKQALQFKDPTITLIISIIGGSLGIDRFFVGDMGLGVIKLITCGGCGIWTIVDWFLIMGTARDRNMQKLQALL